MGSIYYQGFDKMIIHQNNIICDFFDLKTKIAGDILQKFAQYQMPLIIVGNFSMYSSTSLKDFIYESNQGSQVNFPETFEIYQQINPTPDFNKLTKEIVPMWIDETNNGHPNDRVLKNYLSNINCTWRQGLFSR